MNDSLACPERQQTSSAVIQKLLSSCGSVRIKDRMIVIALLASGLFHLGLLVVLNAEWEGPVSPRKPALFGISAGMTAWSLLWCAHVLNLDNRLHSIAVAVTRILFAEVGLITIQFWRGVPSHFNRTTPLDAAIEYLMLALILSATAGIAAMCWISAKPFDVDQTKLLSIRAGLCLLLVSCLLGGLTMVCGEINLANGRPPEFWGRAGVLKYPHGAALHAIQTIPIVNWLLTQLVVPRRHTLIKLVIAAHVLFLAHALWQTFHGRARLEFDLIGSMTLLIAVFCMTVPAVAVIVNTCQRKFRNA